MVLSRLCSKCAKCPKVETCNHKRMEMVGFLEPTSATANSELSNSAIVPHKYRQVKIAPNTTVTIDLEDIKKKRQNSLQQNKPDYTGIFSKVVLNGGEIMTIYERLKSFGYIELFEFISYAFDIYIKPENRDEFFEEFNNLSIRQRLFTILPSL